LVDLAGELGASDTTTFLVGEYSSEQIASYPEFAVADGIVEFARKPLSRRDERFLRVLKLRGSDYHEGLHGLRITSTGVEVFPRLVGQHDGTGERNADRLSSGVPELDAMFSGGLWRGSSTVVVGAAGTGKTTLALQFVIHGVQCGEPGIFLNFQESPSQLARVIRNLGHDLDDLHARGLRLLYFSPVELHIDSIISQLFSAIKNSGVMRLGLDAVGDLLTAASDPDRLHDYLYALMQHMTAEGVTSMFTLETPDSSPESITSGLRLSYMSDNIIELRLRGDEEAPRRQLRILKARGTDHDLAAHEMVIGSNGLSVK
ncbi:MAG TPA: ATPase domain-containing protein, partial [Longimicrobiales bacterium]